MLWGIADSRAPWQPGDSDLRDFDVGIWAENTNPGDAAGAAWSEI